MEAGGREIGRGLRVGIAGQLGGRAGVWWMLCVSCPSQVQHVLVHQVDGPNQGVDFAEFAEYFYVRASTADSCTCARACTQCNKSLTRVHVRRI